MEIMTRLDAGSLRQSERSKLLKYFILYEWAAKGMRAEHVFFTLHHNFNTVPLRYGHRKLSLSDEKAWFSVKTYVASLYQATLSQTTEGVLPEVGLDFRPQTGQRLNNYAVAREDGWGKFAHGRDKRVIPRTDGTRNADWLLGQGEAKMLIVLYKLGLW